MSGKLDMKLEVVVIPVSDVDRAKRFYSGLGWRLDADFGDGGDYRVIQFTPPGSGCSVIFGKNVTAAAPGSAQGLYLIVSDVEAAREELRGRGVAISDVFHDAGGVYAEARRRSGSRAPNVSLVRVVQRSGRQRLAVPGDHRAAARTHGRRDDVHVDGRAGEGTATRRGRARRAREADRRQARRELARMVRRVHGPRAGRRAAADVSSADRRRAG
jgi:catechol 2,3-dioxygenase-like lactoylglutathione lyase family enzyme